MQPAGGSKRGLPGLGALPLPRSPRTTCWGTELCCQPHKADHFPFMPVPIVPTTTSTRPRARWWHQDRSVRVAVPPASAGSCGQGRQCGCSWGGEGGDARVNSHPRGFVGVWWFPLICIWFLQAGGEFPISLVKSEGILV